MEQVIAILDYGMGNINSVSNSLNYQGYEPKIISSAEEIEDSTHLIIPGVGSYAKAMQNIRERNLEGAIHKHVQAGKPMLGICLGMQILSDRGEEGGSVSGLGLISGNVRYLDLKDLPVPHVGWNSLEYKKDHPLFAQVKKHVDFYFVHSYCFNNSDASDVLATTEYGMAFPAIVGKNNVVGIQFHPEKSQDNGLLLLENFCEWDGLC